MKDKKEDFKKIESEKVDAHNKAISSLEEENSSLKKKIIQERFIWIFLLIFTIDIFLFYIYDNIMAPVSLLILETIFLFYIAAEWGISNFTSIIYYIIHILGLYKK